MTWTFEQVRLRGFGKDFPSEWVLKITSLQQLFEYYVLTKPTIIQEAFKDFLETTSKEVQRDHFTNPITSAAVMLAQIEFNSGGKDRSFIDALTDLLSKVERNQMSSLAKGEILYIRNIGSYVPEDGTRYDILQYFESDKLVFPQSSVRFIQWDGGTHWYAKIGNTDIVVDGEQKWDSKKEAQSAVQKYLTEVWKP